MFKILKYSYLTFLLLFSYMIQAQYNEVIRTDRPGQSIGPYSTGKNIFQIQSGLEYAHLSGVSDQYSLPFNSVLRYGLAEKIDINVQFNLQTDWLKFEDIPDETRSGFSNLQVGLRYNIIDRPEGLVPALGIQAGTRVPLHSADYDIDRFAPVIILVTSHKIGSGWSLSTNWISEYDGNSTQANYHYTVNLAFPLTSSLGGFIENYGSLGSDFDTHFDGGLAYLINNDLQLDIYGGFGQNDGISSKFISFGISWRTN